MSDPHGTPFNDIHGRHMRLLYDGPCKGWIVVKQLSGRWEFLRPSTEEERAAVREAMVRAHHEDGDD